MIYTLSVDVQAQIKGLRALADMLEAHPEMAHTIRYELDSITVYGAEKDQIVEWASVAKRFGFRIEKKYDDSYFRMNVDMPSTDDVTHDYGFGIHFIINRELVCERKVISSETVTKKVKDYSQAPEIEREVTEEVVEWECHPLLAPEKETDE